MYRNNLAELYEQLAFRRALLRRVADADAASALKDDIAQLEWVLAETLCVPRESVRMTDAA